MASVLIKLQGGIEIPVQVEALQRRLAASSPVLVLLQQEIEQALHPIKELEILNELPPYLVRSRTGLQALTILIESLGSIEDDVVMLKSLEALMTVPLGVHLYVIAEWMLAEPITRKVAAWFCQLWLRSSECVLTGLSGVDGEMIQLATRSHLFSKASISLTGLGEFATTKISQAQAHVDKMRLCIEQKSAEISGLKALKSAIEAEGATSDLQAVESSFPVFVSFQGQSIVVAGCTGMTNAQDIKTSMALRTGVPESIQRIEFRGKPLLDLEALIRHGVRRDSTLNLALRRVASLRPVPHTIHVKLPGGEILSCAASNDDTVQTIIRKLKLPEGLLVFGGKILEKEQPIALLDLSDAPVMFYVGRRVRRRVA